MKKLILLSLIALVSCKKDQPTETYYENVLVGEQYWMTQNWDAEQYRNGDPIPQITDSAEWVNATYGAWRYYDDNPLNGQRYGKLYNYYAITDPRGFGPEGWHIPNDQEWDDMVFNHGIFTTNVLNQLGGYTGYYTDGLNSYGMWWSSTPVNNTMGSIHRVNSDMSYEQYYICKYVGVSVRFVKD